MVLRLLVFLKRNDTNIFHKALKEIDNTNIYFFGWILYLKLSMPQTKEKELQNWLWQINLC